MFGTHRHQKVLVAHFWLRTRDINGALGIPNPSWRPEGMSERLNQTGRCRGVESSAPHCIKKRATRRAWQQSVLVSPILYTSPHFYTLLKHAFSSQVHPLGLAGLRMAETAADRSSGHPRAMVVMKSRELPAGLQHWSSYHSNMFKALVFLMVFEPTFVLKGPREIREMSFFSDTLTLMKHLQSSCLNGDEASGLQFSLA